MSSPAASTIPIEALGPLVRDAATVNRSGVAATACLIYDIIITLDQEMEYIWKYVRARMNVWRVTKRARALFRSAWTPPKMLYIFSRYFTLIVQLVNMAGQMVIMGVEVLLMLRVYALYKRDKRILAVLVLTYAAEVTTLTVILGLALSKIVSVAPLHSLFPADFPLSGCFPTVVPRFFDSYWIPSLIFESVLFLLMAVNVVRYNRAHTSSMPLLTLLFRDGTVYYAVIFRKLLPLLLTNGLVISPPPPSPLVT
ncbi:hypothetical protein EW145_g8429, partial [Phellinidium pouzarii]